MASPNHPSKEQPNHSPLIVWVYHDQKPGHVNQLEGISLRLSELVNCTLRWKNVHKEPFSLLTLFTHSAEQRPDIILGAGHRTHSSVFLAGLKFHAFTTIIMKPSLPLWFFNAVICPKHDIAEDRPHLLSTLGPINKINPQKSLPLHKRNQGLILLGGDSKHFEFNQENLVNQISSLCKKIPDQHWQLSNSARTPDTLMKKLTALNIPNLSIHQYDEHTLEPMHELLLKTKTVWVTPDSMSMIYEALTAKTEVYLFNLEAKKSTRITLQIAKLIKEGIVNTIKPSAKTEQLQQTKTPLWEADRAARWLITQFQTWMR